MERQSNRGDSVTELDNCLQNDSEEKIAFNGLGLLDEEDVPEEETEADYRARMLHVNTFLRLNETITGLQEMGKTKPEYVSEVQHVLNSSVGRKSPDNLYVHTMKNNPTDLSTNLANESTSSKLYLDADADVENVKIHKHLIYHGDLLQLSKETITLAIPKHVVNLFKRIIECSKRMIMGSHSDKDVDEMRTDHGKLIAMWDAPCAEETGIGSEIKNVMRNILDTPLYYTNSCMALIACGQMLRNLYTDTEGVQAETYDQLLVFVRKQMRHNPADPFECDCRDEQDNAKVICWKDCKTLLSMIMEIPQIVHHQTYILQILAYIMYNKKSGREEVFINNLKNTCSPGLLDKTPTRLALLMGTLDEVKTRRNYKSMAKVMQELNPFRNRMRYNSGVLDKIVPLGHHPKVQALINLLPGANAAVVELHLPKCGADKKNCLNRERDSTDIMSPSLNNNGKKKCCGYLRQDPFDLLVSSVSLVQLLVYLLTDPLNASPESRRHYFVRDIIVAMARGTVKIKTETLEDIFCYLDRTSVFKNVNEHPLMMAALQELITSYIEYMKETSEKYKESGKKRRVKRYLKKNGVPDGAL